MISAEIINILGLLKEITTILVAYYNTNLLSHGPGDQKPKGASRG